MERVVSSSSKYVVHICSRYMCVLLRVEEMGCDIVRTCAILVKDVTQCIGLEFIVCKK